jgi:hypothetical protein
MAKAAAVKKGRTVWPAERVESWPISGFDLLCGTRAHSAPQVAQIAAAVREWSWTNPVLIADFDLICDFEDRQLGETWARCRAA